MITVIIPTMWVPDFFPGNLKKLCECELVSEIILISNAEVPKGVLLNHEKLVVLQQAQNIGVNPAWNLGAATAKNEHLVFLNDDYMPTLGFFQRALDADADIVGINQDKTATQDVIATYRQEGFGCCFYMKKGCFIEIPSALRIYYGDDVLFYVNVLLGRKVVLLANIKTNGVMSMTSHSQGAHVNRQEAPVYASVINSVISQIAAQNLSN